MLKSIRNSLVATSILYVVLGILLMLFPEHVLSAACTLIGIVTLAYGAIRIVSYFKGDGAYANRFDLFFGVLLAAAGIFLLICPQTLGSLIPIALGIYILVDSVTAMKKALDMKALGFEKWWISFLVALALAAVGVVILLNPFEVMASLVIFIGVGFVFDGVYTLTNTLIADRAFRN